jgi:hypothetical protein
MRAEYRPLHVSFIVAEEPDSVDEEDSLLGVFDSYADGRTNRIKAESCAIIEACIRADIKRALKNGG